MHVSLGLIEEFIVGVIGNYCRSLVSSLRVSLTSIYECQSDSCTGTYMIIDNNVTLIICVEHIICTAHIFPFNSYRQ